MVLFGWWLVEKAVLWTPPVAVVLYLAIPDRSRPSWGSAVVGGLVVVFCLNLLGVYPTAPAHVTCTFDSGCKRTAGAEHVGDERRHGTGPSLITPVPAVGVGVRGGISTPPYVRPPRRGRRGS